MFNLPDFNLLMALLLSRVVLAGGGEDLLLRSHTSTHHTRGQQQLRLGCHGVMRHVMCHEVSCVNCVMSLGIMSVPLMQHVTV